MHQISDMDLQDIDCQKRLIKTFINSVFVYDDKVILTFNYSSDQRTITLNEINGGLQEGVRISPSDVHQQRNPPKRVDFFIGMAFTQRRFEKSDATVRSTVAADGLTEANLYFCNAKMQTSLLKSTHKKYRRKAASNKTV